MKIPDINSRWVRTDNTYSKERNGYNGYTVRCVTNIANSHPEHPPQVVYCGDNGHWWSLPLSEWPGNLKEE